MNFDEIWLKYSVFSENMSMGVPGKMPENDIFKMYLFISYITPSEAGEEVGEEVEAWASDGCFLLTGRRIDVHKAQ